MGKIVSHTPGRVRVRVRPELRRPEAMQRIRTRLAREPGVRNVETNAATGSVLVHYNHDGHSGRSLGDLVGVLQDVGVILHEVSEGPEEEAELPSAGHSTAAAGVVGTLDDLDRRLSALTGHTIDLRFIFPLGLGAIGVYQLLRNGWQFTEVPAYVLLWYAFDSFYKLHRMPGHEGIAPPAAPRGRSSANGAARHA